MQDHKVRKHSKERNGKQRSHHSHHENIAHDHRQHKRSRRDQSPKKQHRRNGDNRDKHSKHGPSRRIDPVSEDGIGGDSGSSDYDAGIAKEALEPPVIDTTLDEEIEHLEGHNLTRDAWMETPSSLDVEYVQRPRRDEDHSLKERRFLDAEHDRKIHDKELNHHLRDLHEGKADESREEKNGKLKDRDEGQKKHKASYTFGDSGSPWRMTRLRNVYRQAKESRRPVEEVAFERFGSLREFDDAREEEIELDRRKMYGKDYVGKEKPSGELFHERMRKEEQHEKAMTARMSNNDNIHVQGEIMREASPPAKTVVLDATALNKLKAQMMKAKLRGAPDAVQLEEEYNAASNAAATNLREPEVIVVDASHHRMLGGSRQGEVRLADGKRARERGQLEENEDMSIEDMVRQERRTKYQPGGEGKLLAERIAKDGKFDVSRSYNLFNVEQSRLSGKFG